MKSGRAERFATAARAIGPSATQKTGRRASGGG